MGHTAACTGLNKLKVTPDIWKIADVDGAFIKCNTCISRDLPNFLKITDLYI